MFTIWLPSNRWLIYSLFLDGLDYVYSKSFGDFNSAFHLWQEQAVWAFIDAKRKPEDFPVFVKHRVRCPKKQATQIYELFFSVKNLFSKAAVGIYRCLFFVCYQDRSIHRVSLLKSLCLPEKREEHVCFLIVLGGSWRLPQDTPILASEIRMLSNDRHVQTFIFA